jgi:hypothetical protein
VLARRGWSCVGIEGSGGSILFVTPKPIDLKNYFSDKWKGIDGDGIQIAYALPGTSGRFEAARIAARVFPEARRYVEAGRAAHDRSLICIIDDAGPLIPLVLSAQTIVEPQIFVAMRVRRSDMSGIAADGPDFLCVGMGKAGTGWLYDQVAYHPDFWMPPVKELHYLNREEPKLRKVKRYLERRGSDGAVVGRSNRPRLDEKRLQFLEEVQAARGNAMDLEFYASLFRFKGCLLSGDITPSYCSMPDDLIAKIVSRFPRIKVILLARDPVGRALSHFSMLHRNGKVDPEIFDDIARFRAYFETSRAAHNGAPADTAKRWMRHVPKENFIYYFFEDLQSDPHGLRRQVLEFLGADPAKETAIAAEVNRKARLKVEFSQDIKAFLVERFGDELIECGTIFGSHAEGWAAKYGIAAARA